jgi:hypothetical protein
MDVNETFYYNKEIIVIANGRPGQMEVKLYPEPEEDPEERVLDELELPLDDDPPNPPISPYSPNPPIPPISPISPYPPIPPISINPICG